MEYFESLTPVADTNRLLFTSVEHRSNDHKARRDGSLTHAEQKAYDEKSSEVLASGVRAESDSTDEYVNAKKWMSSVSV